jgi:modulator of FtsH protease
MENYIGNAYQPELWRDLYVMLGTSATAFIGLLFIVISLHLDEIVNNPVFRTRAHNNTIHLLTLVLEAVLILIPQSMLILGAELVAINLFGLRLPVSVIYKYYFKNKEIGNRGGFSIYRGITNMVGYLFGIAGGALLIEQSNWGMYLVAASFVIFLVCVVLNAWDMMLGIGQAENK